MTDTDERTPFEAELEAARERQRVAQRAAQADDLERENQLYRAGIPLHTNVGEMFMATFDGDIDDLDAIQAAWFEATDRPVPTDIKRRLDAKEFTNEMRRARRKIKE